MPEVDITPDSQVESEVNSQVETTTETQEEELDAKSLKAELEKVRREAQNLRKRAKDAESKVKEKEEADLSELDKSKRLAEELQEKLTAKEAEARSAKLESLSHKLGIVDAEAAEKLLNWQEIEDGKSLEDALLDLIKAKPYLKNQQISTGSAANPSRGTAAPISFTKEQIKDHAFYLANESSIIEAMQAGRIR